MGRGTPGEDLEGLALPGGAHSARHRRVSADGGVLPSLPGAGPPSLSQGVSPAFPGALEVKVALGSVLRAREGTQVQLAVPPEPA
eukprot:14453580-Alexandrium_andersonii.AAC.1